MTAGKYMFASNKRVLCARINPGRNKQPDYEHQGELRWKRATSAMAMVVVENYVVIHWPERCAEVY